MAEISNPNPSDGTEVAETSSVTLSVDVTHADGDSMDVSFYDASTVFDISTAIFSQSIDTQDSSPKGIAWNNDGTKLYEVGDSSEKIYEYDVSTAFDISTATFSQSINTQDRTPRGIAWNNDGTKLYEIGTDLNRIYEYDVSTPFDISTATFSQSIGTQDSSPMGIAWNNDGSKLYEVGASSRRIYESDVSTAFDISTATFSQSIDTQGGHPRVIAWNNDGTKLYEVGVSFVSSIIYESDVSTPFDISTATFSQSIDTQDSSPLDIAWNNDGNKLYEVGDNANKIYEYNVSEQIGTTQTGIASGNTASVDWTGLSSGTTYSWYAIADDGIDTTQSSTYSFTITITKDGNAIFFGMNF